MQAADFSGGRASKESQSFCMPTSSAAETKLGSSLNRLPTGNLVSGLPAAIMSRAQVRFPCLDEYISNTVLSWNANPKSIYVDEASMCKVWNVAHNA